MRPGRARNCMRDIAIRMGGSASGGRSESGVGGVGGGGISSNKDRCRMRGSLGLRARRGASRRRTRCACATRERFGRPAEVTSTSGRPRYHLAAHTAELPITVTNGGGDAPRLIRGSSVLRVSVVSIEAAWVCGPKPIGGPYVARIAPHTPGSAPITHITTPTNTARP